VSVAGVRRRPRDSKALNPAAWKLALGVTVGVVIFLALVFGGIAAAGHRNDVIGHLTADWRSPSGASPAQLSIWPKGESGIGPADVPAITPLELSGTVAGRPVSGEVKVPRWPPMGSSAYALIGGVRWALRVDLAHDRLTVVSGDGRTFTLSPGR
jgi:hypothetical protein